MPADSEADGAVLNDAEAEAGVAVQRKCMAAAGHEDLYGVFIIKVDFVFHFDLHKYSIKRNSVHVQIH
jgi:hypothetical protein